MTVSGSRLRVAQLVETLAAGGAETLAVNIASSLAQRGHDSHLIVLRGEGPLRGRVSDRVTLHDLAQAGPGGGQVARIARFAATTERVRSIMRSTGATVLQSHLPMGNFIGLGLALRRQCLTFPTVHNNRELDYGDNAGPMRRALRRQGYRLMVRHCTRMIAVSEQVRESLAGELALGPSSRDRFAVVRNGVVLPPVATEADRARAREAWGLPPGSVLILAVGRLTYQKNLTALVHALARAEIDDVDWRCVIAGEGELRAEIEQEISAAGLADRVFLPGVVSDVDGLMKAADIFCLPSRFEGLPLVLLEAMAFELPIVSFAIDGVVEVVQDGVQGRLAAPGQVGAMAQALTELARDRDRRRALGRAARIIVQERHDFALTVDALESLYRSAGAREA